MDPFAQLPPGLDNHWSDSGISPEFFEETARWLAEERNLHGNCHRFFGIAATLIRLARLDYLLGSVAFFQAVPGLERALSMHYGKDDEKLHHLLKHAKDDGLVHDGLFVDPPAFTPRFTEQFEKKTWNACATRTEQLVFLIPKLRNQYFHGTYLLAPDYLHLTIQLRQIADTLTTDKLWS